MTPSRGTMKTVEEVLPPTYYADMPTVWRVEMLAKAWFRAMEVNAQLEARVAELEATIKRDMGGDYLSLQALYINQLGVTRGHEQDRAKVQAALGNGANEDLWQPGTSWVDAAIRAIQHYENHLQC